MKMIYPDLWQTAVEHPFPGLNTHAYLLTRPNGNVLFYSTGHASELDEIEALGGITHQLLSHRDEVGPALVRIKERFGSRLCCHELEKTEVAKACPPDITFDERGMHLGDIEVIPTPGHTPGSLCFIYRSPHGKTYLFTGDTMLVGDDGRWDNGFLPQFSHKADLADSLRLLRMLEPDVVISSASLGHPLREIGPGEWQAAVDEALQPLLTE